MNAVAIPTSRPHLVRHGLGRFRRLASCMFGEVPVPLRAAMTDLAGRLAEIPPSESRDYVAAAAGHIRATLIELARETSVSSTSQELREWVWVHGAVDGLTAGERELFDLLLYWGLKEAEASALLGITTGGVRVCWNAARLALQEASKSVQAEGQ